MADAKCAHEPCNCKIHGNTGFGKYCSEHCKGAAGMTELRCTCPHPECRRG